MQGDRLGRGCVELCQGEAEAPGAGLSPSATAGGSAASVTSPQQDGSWSDVKTSSGGCTRETLRWWGPGAAGPESEGETGLRLSAVPFERCELSKSCSFVLFLSVSNLDEHVLFS